MNEKNFLIYEGSLFSLEGEQVSVPSSPQVYILTMMDRSEHPRTFRVKIHGYKRLEGKATLQKLLELSFGGAEDPDGEPIFWGEILKEELDPLHHSLSDRGNRSGLFFLRAGRVILPTSKVKKIYSTMKNSLLEQ